MSGKSRVIIGALAVLVLAGGGYYYWGMKSAAELQKKTAAAAAPPPPSVGIIEVKRRDVPFDLAYAGRVAGFRSVEIRSLVTGTILKREYPEGARVKQGDVLFRIDQRPYQATLDRANAQLAQARATRTQTEENFDRIEELARKQVATPKQLDDARAARDQARGAVQSVEADIENAKLNLEFTVVKAPVSGPTALLSPPEGSIAQAQQTVLTTITQLDPAYVNFSTTDSEFREFRQMNEARAKPLTEDDISVTLLYGDGTTYPQTGKVSVSSQTVDQRTGTLQIRSIFPNPDGALLPGQFVRLIIKGVVLQNAVLIPQQAVSQTPQGMSVYTINSAGNAEVRPVKLDREVANGWIVKEGLNDGDKVIVDGVMRVRPGAPVRPSPWAPKGAPGAQKAQATNAPAKDAPAAKDASPAKDTPAGQDKK